VTSQAYQTDDGQLMQDRDQVVLETHLMGPEADLAVAEPDLAEPDADRAQADPAAGFAVADAAGPDPQLGEPDADQAQDEHSAMVPVSASAPADSASATSLASDYPGFSADSDSAEETAMADSSSGNPEPVSAVFMMPEPVAESQPAADTASEAEPWNEIQAMFVDDPRASIERAAGLVDDRVEALIQSVRERQRSVQSAWQADDAGTEELRVALQHYRTFCKCIYDLPE
jgi:hypothetical protein